MTLTEQFYRGLRVEVKTTGELRRVLRYLENRMPHWKRERWHYENARPRDDLPAIGLSNGGAYCKIVDGAVVVAQLPAHENTISFQDFLAQVRKRGPYGPRKSKVEVA